MGIFGILNNLDPDFFAPVENFINSLVFLTKSTHLVTQTNLAFGLVISKLKCI